jgi:hypothetical protein
LFAWFRKSRYFQTGREKFQKNAKSSKIFYTVKAAGEQKAVSLSLMGPFSSLFGATSCDQYFSDYDFEIENV